MLKYFMFMVFLIPLGFTEKYDELFSIFCLFLLLIVNSYASLYPWDLGYKFWFDSLSYSLVLLSVWIVLLVIMASGSILFSSFYSVGFISLVLMFFMVSSFSLGHGP